MVEPFKPVGDAAQQITPALERKHGVYRTSLTLCWEDQNTL